MSSTDVPNHDAAIIATAVVFNVLATVAVILRLISKWLTTRALYIEDWLLIGSWVVATATHTLSAVAIQFGMGRHMGGLSDAQLESFGKFILVVLICQPTTLALSKLSVLALLHRIFITRSFRITVYVLSGVVIAWYLSILFADVFVCTPVQAHWDPLIGGDCGALPVLDIVSPIPWIATDLAILIAPLPLVWRLRLHKPHKFGVLAIFFAGIVTTVVSCVRYKEMFFSAQDMSWTSTNGVLLTIAEAQTAVICAAMIACKGVFNVLTGRRDSEAQEEIPTVPPSRTHSAFASARGRSHRTSQEAMTGHNRPSAFDSDPEGSTEAETISMDTVSAKHGGTVRTYITHKDETDI